MPVIYSCAGAMPKPAALGVWTNVTPAAVSLDINYGGGSNYGIETVGVDSTHPGTLYFFAHNQGIWKSVNYGLTWTGPISTGTNSAAINSSAGGITVAPTAGAPTIYAAFIRGSLGLYKSTDGGINWTNPNLVPPMATTQDVYRPKVDPYNSSHLLMTGHEQNYVLESTDAGATWSSVTMNAGMLEPGGTAFIFFIDTGNSGTTAQTWLWIAQETGGTYGTWRTTNAGSTWTKVDNVEHPHGASQIYQPDTSGVVFICGSYSALGTGVLRSTDYGATWAHVGLTDSSRTVVWASATKIYAAYGWPIGVGTVNPALETAALPGTGTWTEPGTPMSQGPNEVAVVFDGSHYVFLASCFNAGIWRYIEP